MANTRSAKKMVRKIARRTEINTARRSRMRRMMAAKSGSAPTSGWSPSINNARAWMAMPLSPRP